MKNKGLYSNLECKKVMKIKFKPQYYLRKLKRVLDSVNQEKIALLIEKISFLSKKNNTIFVIGNGGSAATASHMACDLDKTSLNGNTSEKKYQLRVNSLTDNVSLITALANDYGYEHIFSEQLKILGGKGDLLIVLTCSGNSPNIVRAVQTAKQIGLYSYGLVGCNGGKVKDLLDDIILIDSNDYGLIEDTHMIINHLITDWFKRENLNENS